MSVDRFARIETLYQAARLRPPAERAAFIAEACADDDALRSEVESLLAQPALGVLTAAPPALARGTTIGSYRILEQIGAGGMGEVYRAHDTKLGRDVALKVLPEALASDRDRLARLEREARLLAALNHGNIAHVYGLEESSGTRALVMELVEGETLADRIARGPIPVAEALPIARQIAFALAAAHEQGIIHRDLKPGNIKLRTDGTVKVLDFGLARASDMSRSTDLMNSPTISAGMTGQGVILGTAAYMSPEQASGKPVDRRTDLWAFGVVLMEMLTGRRVFDGDSVVQVLSSVLKSDPDWSGLPLETPPAVRRLLRRCLAKNPADRLESASDARLDLEDHTEATSLHSRRSNRRFLIGAVVASIAIGSSAALLLFRSGRSPASGPPVRLSVELGADASMSAEVCPNVALSSDGTTLAFVALTHDARTGQLFVRHLDQLSAIPLPGTEEARNPFFSPDGQSIAFFDDVHSKLKRVPVTGGAVTTICDAPGGRGAEWLDDGSIVVQAGPYSQTFARVAAGGGTPQPFITATDIHDSIRWPQVLPGGGAVLYTTGRAGRFEAGKIVAQRVGGTPHVVVSNGYYGRYVDGNLLYVSHGSLLAVPFDVSRLEVTGPPIRIVDGVLGSPGTGSAEVAVSRTGVLMYVPSRGTEDAISWMDRSGASTVLRGALGMWTTPVLSPDGGRLALEISDGTDWNLWVYDLARETLTKVTFDGAGSFAAWSPDGQRLAIGLLRDGAMNLHLIRADGAGEPQRLTKSANHQQAWSWHPSGRFLAYSETRPNGKQHLMVLPMSGDETSGWKAGEAREFHPTPFNESEPVFSPDGRWVAYRSDETGQPEVFVRPFPGSEPKQLVSADGGDFPQWSPAKKELLFRGADNRIMAVSYDADNRSFGSDKPHPWSSRPLPSVIMRPLEHTPFTVSPDGERVALFVPPEPAPGHRDKVVLQFNVLRELLRNRQTTK